MAKRGGRLLFCSGYFAHIDSQAFHQPSLVPLWILTSLVALSSLGIGLALTHWTVRLDYKIQQVRVVFSIAEGIPIPVFADRADLRNAQRAAIAIGKVKLAGG